MAQPILIIGIGGTGQQILVHVKRNLENSYSSIPSHVQLLALDTTKDPDDDELKGIHRWIGGQALQYGRAIAAANEGQPAGRDYGCIAEWHDARYYLSIGADTQYNLDIGAGADRQFGRLAVFFSLSQGNQSALRSALEAAITNIAQAGHTAFYAAVTGSLVGGTGSGMFADIAYLVQAIAETKRMTARVRGYFVLPEAFFGKQLAREPTTGRQSIQRKAFAAMREEARFAAEFKYSMGHGIPMHYVCNSTDRVLHGRNEFTLFELLYYFDGWRQQNSLQQIEVAKGVAPTIADEIVAMVDDDAGNMLLQHAINVRNQKGQVYGAEKRRDVVTVGSIGSYTYMLPIELMTEGWTTRMADNALRFLLDPSDAEDPAHPGQIVSLNSGSAATDAQRWWEKSSLNSPALVDLGNMGVTGAQGQQTRTGVVQALKSREANEWVQKLMPAAQDPALDADRQRVQNNGQKALHPVWKGLGPFRSKDPNSQVELTEQLRNEPLERRDPAIGAERIRGRADFFLSQLCGDKGEVAQSLRRSATWHRTQFEQALRVFVLATLNGSADNTPASAIANKKGKVGYIRTFLRAERDQMDMARQLIDQARTERRQEKGASNIVADLSQRFDQMRGSYHKQEDYLERCQDLLDVDRWDLYAKVEQELATAVRDFINKLLESVDAWANMLGLGPDNTLTRIQREKRSIAEGLDRLQAELANVRYVINDSNYDASQYHFYTNRSEDPDENEIYKMLSDFAWAVQVQPDYDKDGQVVGSHLTLRLTLHNGGIGTAPDAALDINQPDFIYESLLRRAARAFQTARSEESICGYLMRTWDWRQNPTTTNPGPATIAQQMQQMAGPLLQYNDPDAYSYNYLLLHREQGLKGQNGFVTEILNQLATQAGVHQALAPQWVHATDRFRMTLLYHREVINIEKSQSYMDAKGLYTQQLMNGQSADLRLLHVVAAEQNAVLYEALIGTGELLPPRVRMLLADQEKFKLAASCWLYGGGSEMLHMHQYGSGAGKMSMWVLTVPPGIGEEDDRGLPREPEHFGLTTPKPGVPDILDAFETLVLSGEVQWYWEGDPDGQPRDYSTNPRPIPYGRILGTENSRSSFNRIEAKISQDIDDRKQREELGKKASMLTGPLSRLKEQDLANYESLLSQFEKLTEGEDRASKEYDNAVQGLQPGQTKSPQAYLYLLLQANFKQERISLRKVQIEDYMGR